MNSTGRLGAVVRKEFLHIARDPRTLVLVLAIPIVQLVLFGFAVSFDVSSVRTLVIDQDGTPASRDYLAAYEGSGFFTVVGTGDELSDVDDAFHAGTADAAVIVPAGFARTLARGQKAAVSILVDGSDTNSARVAEAMATALNSLADQRIAVSWADANGIDTQAGQLTAQSRTWYNPDRISSLFLIPGLMVVIVMIVTVQQTAVTLVRERDLGTAEQLRISPLRQTELMVGKLIPWTVLGLADATLIAVLGMIGFGLPLRGDPWTLGAGAALFVCCALGLGLLISALAPSAETANILGIMVAFLPGFLLSGFAFPLEIVPPALQWLSCLFPARYMVTISRGVFLKGAGFETLWPQLVQLGAYAVVVLALATLLYARRQR
ncbi:ABC transporter permease [Propionicicella superfundia]|uniref:ABC transporter permease n=1 Tax=Propionicicella superfundia TaxID=348582 RepID=UPI000416C51C|nr:ABC transporter permease [Propionicicella superfundia]